MCNVYYTLGQKSILRAVSVCTKITLFCGSVGGAGEWPHTCMFGTFLFCPLAPCMPTYSHFQINRALGETFKFFVAIFTAIKVVIF